MRCPHCGENHPNTAKYCMNTGKKIESSGDFVICHNPDCDYRQPLPANTRFCPNCGIPLNGIHNAPSAGDEPLNDTIFNSKFTYDEIDEFREGLARVMRDGKYGFINTRGEEIIPCKFDDYCSFFMDGYSTIHDYENDTEGIIDKTGKIIIPCKYDWISYDDNINSFHVNKDGKEGIISSDGKLIVPPVWDKISWYCGGFAMAKKQSKYYVIDKMGQVVITIPSSYCEARIVSNSLFAVKRNNKWGIIDKNNQVKIQFIYEDISEYSGRNMIEVKNNGLVGLLDLNLKEIFPCRYERIFSDDNRAILCREDGYCELFNLRNKRSLCVFKGFHRSDDNYISFRNEDDMCGLIDWDGNMIIPDDKYKILVPEGSLIYAVYNDEEEASYYENDYDFDPDDYDYCCMIDIDGNWKIPPIYESILSPGSIQNPKECLIVAKFKGNYCIINGNNELIFANNIDIDEWKYECERYADYVV